MKHFVLLLALVAAGLSAAAQPKTTPLLAAVGALPAGYAELLAATIQDVLNAEGQVQRQAAVSKLERAAAASPADWLPCYYQAYGCAMLCFNSHEEGEAKDKYLDRAEAALAQARRRNGDPSELLVLQAYIYQARLTISPMFRSVKYMGLMGEVLEQARKVNPANPRIYLVQGTNVYYLPKMMGGGPEAAQGLFAEAKRRYVAFRPSSPLAPAWGEAQVDSRLKAVAARAAAQRP